MTAKPVTFAFALLALLPAICLALTPDEALLNAVRTGDHETARALLTGRADPNRRLADGSTSLSWAVETQDREMVRLLLDRGARANGTRTASVAPLMIACQHGDPGIIDMLLTARADAKLARSDGIGPLSLCARNAPASLVKRLIAAGAQVDKADAKGQTPLMHAAAHGRIENIQLLIAQGAAINRVTLKGFTPLFFALKSGEPGVAGAVLDAGGDADYIAPDGTSVVQLAMYQKDYGFAARMIERGADLAAFDRNGNQLLHAAILADQSSLVKLLLAKGANPNAQTGPSKVKMAFEANFKSGEYAVPPKTPLLLAAERGSVDIMRMLVDTAADPTFRAADGTDIVLAAVASSKVAALELALQLAPDPNTTNAEGQTPLHLLLSSGSGTEGAGNEIAAMMKLLADKGARTDIRNRTGKTPADIAADPQLNVSAAFETVFAKRSVGL